MKINIEYAENIGARDLIFPKDDLVPFYKALGQEVLNEFGGCLPQEAKKALEITAAGFGLRIEEIGKYGIPCAQTLKITDWPRDERPHDSIKVTATSVVPQRRAELAVTLASLRRTGDDPVVKAQNKILDRLQMRLGIEEIRITESKSP